MSTRAVSLRGRVLLIRAKVFLLFQYLALLHQVPAAIAQQVDSIAWKYLWKNKMGSVLAKKKAFKSIEAGGLNYPDIRTQVKARRCCLVRDLLNPNSTAFWAQVQQRPQGGLIGIQGFHLGMILAKTPLRRFKPSLDPFWLESFTWWKEIAGDRLTVTDDWEPEEVIRVPIAGIHQVTIPTATQISSTKAAEAGVVLLQHILWPEVLPTQQQRKIAQRGHSAWQRGRIILAAAIQNKIQNLAAPVLAQSGIPLARIKVANSPADEYITSTGAIYLRQARGDFNKLEAHNFGQQEGVVDQRMWKWCRSRFIQPKHSDVIWKALHNKLPLGTKHDTSKAMRECQPLALCAMCMTKLLPTSC